MYGSSASLKQFIDEKRKNSVWVQSPKFTTVQSQLEENDGAVMSFHSVAEESIKMMTSLKKKLNAKAESKVGGSAVSEKIPLAASRAIVNDSGLQIVSRSAFGNFPLVTSLVDSIF